MSEEIKPQRFIVGEVPTNYGFAVIDTKDNKAFTELQLLAMIANDIQELKKLLN